METEIKNIIPFTITPKKSKCLGISLRKYGQNLYVENYNMLMKEIKDLNKCTDCVFTDGKTQYIVKMSILPKSIYRFRVIPIKIPARIFVDTDKLILKFIWKGTTPRMLKRFFLKRGGQSGGITLPDIKAYCTATVIETV